MLRKLTVPMEERLEKILNRMEFGMIYSWDKFSKMMDLHVPDNGSKKEHRLYVQDRCGVVRQLNDIMKTRKILVRVKVHHGDGVEKIEGDTVAPHIVRHTFRRLKAVELKGLENLEALKFTPDLSPEQVRLIERSVVIIEAAIDVTNSAINRSKLLKPILIQIE